MGCKDENHHENGVRHKVIKKWECKFEEYCKRHPRIYEYIEMLRVLSKTYGKINQQFGRSGQMPLLPWEYFGEMLLLFCNREVESHNFSEAVQLFVIGEMKAKQMMFASPLLELYLDYGMKSARFIDCLNSN